MIIRSVQRVRNASLLLFFLTISFGLAGCTPERRAILKLTAVGFRDQATAAIESVQQLYQLKEPQRSPEEIRTLLLDRLLQSKTNVGDVRQVDRIILRSSNQLAVRQTQVDAALNDLKAEYETAAAVFSDIDQLDFANPNLVTQAAKPARSLTVKLLLLAKLLSQSPPTPGDSYRVAISARINQLRQRYNTPNLPESERQSIRSQLSQQIDEWLKVDAEERRMVCDAIAKLVRAAETGQKLSKLANEYGERRLEDILEEAVRIIGAASSVTGRDFGAIAARLQNVNSALNSDPSLKAVMQDVLNRSSDNTWNASNQSGTAPDLLQCQP